MIPLAVSCNSAALAGVLSALKKIIRLIQIIGPILLIIAIALNVFKLLSNPDDKKIPKKILNSVIAAVLLFFIPMFVNLVMSLMGENFNVSACWNSAGNVTSSSSYSNTNGGSPKSFINSSSDYEK